MQRYVNNFVHSVELLFQGEECLRLPGFTKHVMDLLRAEDLPVFINNSLQFLGGAPSQGAVRRCLNHMCNWTKLAREVVQAEFPDYNLFAAFAAFDVHADQDIDAVLNCMHIDRMAKAFGVDGPQLRGELLRHRPLVQAAVSGGTPLREAWQDVLRKTQTRGKATRDAYPAEALAPVTQRYLAWSVSSSGVEQTFSRFDHAGLGRTPASTATENLRLRLLTSRHDEAEEKWVVHRAQELYVRLFPGGARTRDTSRKRLDKGTKRPRDGKGDSEVGFLRTKRRAVRDAINAEKASKGLPGKADAAIVLKDLRGEAAGWTDGHAKELAFLRAKQAKRKVEAFRDGLLLDHEVSADLVKKVAEQDRQDRKNDDKNRRDAKRTSRKAAMACRPLPWGVLSHLMVWVDKEGLRPEQEQAVQQRLQERGMARTQDRVRAHVFFVSDPSKPGQRVEWLAALRGGWVASRSYLVKGKGGAFIKYAKGVAYTSRRIWVSPAFRAKHRGIYEMLSTAAQWPGSQWHLVPTLEGFARLCAAGGGNIISIVLARADESLDLPAGAGGARVLDKDNFLKGMQIFDTSACGCK